MRGIMGFDQGSGAMAVGGGVRLGQRLRFMVRDKRGAQDDLRAHALALKRRELQVHERLHATQSACREPQVASAACMLQ